MEGLQTCGECGRNVDARRVISFQDALVCQDCKDIYFQRIQEGIEPRSFGPAGETARPLIRGAARILDWFISAAAVWLILIVLLVPLGFSGAISEETFQGGDTTSALFLLIYYVINFAVPCAYESLMVGKYQATLGKMVFGLRVVRPDGERLSYWRSFGRYWGAVLSSMVCFLGYLMAFFNEDRTALHDSLVDSRVIRI